MKVNYKEIFLESFRMLFINKLRTGLAILGIIIGIGSVIALISIGQASTKSVEDQIESLGSNLLTIQPGSTSSGNVRGAMGSSTTLTQKDAEAITKLTSIITNVSPEVSSRSQVSTSGTNTNTQVYGVTEAYATVHKVEITTGRFINNNDDTNVSKIAVLGPTVAETLFTDANSAVGKTIRIGNINFTVVGVTESKGGTGMSNQDDMIYIPLTTAQKQITGQDYLSSISLQIKDKNLMTNAQDTVGYLLLKQHKISDVADADFTIMSQEDILSSATKMTDTLTALLGGIAAISLLVGGIGIMNIMLVTVTERTREIGLRKALGATKKIIIIQFLTEAIILTFSGGIIGVILGIGVAYGYSIYNSSTFTLSFESIALAFGVSVIIGIAFGWYPAKKASNLQPIEALRYE